jgi:opacity protein-like surface antigen
MFALAALAATALLSSNAMAVDEANWYGGLTVGSTQFKGNAGSQRKTSYGVQLGYSFNPNVAAELQVQRLGKWSNADGSIKANAVSGSVLGKAPVNDVVSLFARLGLSRNSVKVSGDEASFSAHKTQVLYGLGADFRIDPHMSLRAEYVNLGNNNVDRGIDIKIQQFNVSLNYLF